MPKVFNRARMTTATTGTGTVTLGSALTGYQTFASAGVVNGDVVHYTIEDGTNWEVGYGTYSSSGTTLSRTLVQSSTGSLLNLSGAAQIFISAPASAFPLAPLGTTADRYAYTTGQDTWVEGTITSAGRALIDDADAAAQRTTLGLGTIATQNASNVNITGGSISGVTMNPQPGDVVNTARTLSAPAYIGVSGAYLKTDYPALSSLPLLTHTAKTWSTVATGFNGNAVLDIVYGNGVWIAVGQFGWARRSINNGASWSTLSTGIPTSDLCVGYGNGVWIIASASTTPLRRSTDNGGTWATPTGAPQSIGAIEYGNGVWIATNRNGNGNIYRSTDNGVTWSTVYTGYSKEISSIAYGNGVWLITNWNNSLLRSTNDGVSWSLVSFSGFGYNLSFGNGVFCAAAGRYSSDNGSTWTIADTGLTSPYTYSFQVYGNNMWLAGGGGGANLGNLRRARTVASSWMTISATLENTLYCAAYANGVWIAAGVGANFQISTDSPTQIEIDPDFANASAGRYLYTGV